MIQTENILFVSLTDEATIKAKRFIKECRVTLSFVIKFKLVIVLSLFLLTLIVSSLILGLNGARTVSRVVI